MNYYKIETTGNLDDRSLCILANSPDFYLSGGSKVGDDFPKNAKYYMDDEHLGTKLCPFISNLHQLLILSSEIVDIIKQVCDNGRSSICHSL